MKYLNKEDIDSNNITISNNVIHLDKYDMYYINIGLKNGKKQQIRAFAEKGTLPDINSSLFKKYQKRYEKALFAFFVDRLLGPSGLMARSGRDDYIYLGGEFMQNGLVANRWIMQENGKSSHENFEDNFFKIKMQVEARENREDDKGHKQGKHYAIADIHGMYGSYMDVIKRLSPEDHLYVIGDVIDRGNCGIKILKDIMRRIKSPKNNPDITFLMGNHEMQFIESISIMLHYDLDKQDFLNIINRKRVKDNIENCELDNDYKRKNEYEEQLKKCNQDRNRLISEKGISGAEIKYLEIWLTTNKGSDTMLNYCDCSPEERNEICEFMYNSYVALPQKIGNRDYLLVHAMPPKDEYMIRYMKEHEDGYRLSDLSRMQYEFMLQTRENEESTYDIAKNYGFTTICGHDAILGDIIKDKKKGYIRIDTGCGYNLKQSKLALYCIEDDEVQYIDEKERMQDVEI